MCEQFKLFQVEVFRDVTSLHPGYVGIMDIWNVGFLPHHYTASKPRRPQVETSPPRKPKNSQFKLCYHENV